MGLRPVPGCTKNIIRKAAPSYFITSGPSFSRPQRPFLPMNLERDLLDRDHPRQFRFTFSPSRSSSLLCGRETSLVSASTASQWFEVSRFAGRVI